MGLGTLPFLTLWWVASAAGAVGASPPALFTGAPSPALGCIRLHLAELCARGLLLCVPLVRNPSSFNSLTACS